MTSEALDRQLRSTVMLELGLVDINGPGKS